MARTLATRGTRGETDWRAGNSAYWVGVAEGAFAPELEATRLRAVCGELLGALEGMVAAPAGRGRGPAVARAERAMRAGRAALGRR